jgi:hypothetical protein
VEVFDRECEVPFRGVHEAVAYTAKHALLDREHRERCGRRCMRAEVNLRLHLRSRISNRVGLHRLLSRGNLNRDAESNEESGEASTASQERLLDSTRVHSALT